MAKRIFIRKNWLAYAIVMMVIGIVVINTTLVNGEIIPEGWDSLEAKGAYRPYPILFLHGFAGGSNYTWNPDPNAKDQAEEQKKPSAVLNEYFKKYFRVDKALNNLTQFQYLETIEFFNSKSSNADQLMDRNSSVDRFKIGDYYVEHGVWWHKKKEGDPGWSDKVSYALRGEPIHDLSKYLYDTGAGGGPVLKNYLPPNATSFKALLVCHSMGGLSAREYLTNKIFYPGVEKSVDRLITIDTPHLGSVLAILADATVEVQRIATSVSIAYPQFGWLMAAPVVIEVIDNGLELIGKIDIDGDAVNDMDPLSLLGRFSSGFLGQLNARSHPQGVQYYIVYGRHPVGGIIDGFSIQGFINSLMGKGISIEEVDELLEKEYGAEIGIGEIIVTSVGDGVVSENSQRGILKEESGSKIRVFEIAKESIKGVPTEIEINADHSAATKKVAEIVTDDVPPLLKLIDYTKPRLEIAKPQEGFVWESGATVTLEGKVYDEYLPADSSIKIELYKAGDNFNPVHSEIRKPDPITGYTPLKPTTLWRANDPNTPVAEFKEEVNLPSGTNPEATYTIKLTVLNPAGISSDPKQVTEKTFYLYGVGGTSNLWCIDGPTSLADGHSAVVNEFNLVDENGIKIQSRPLDIASSGNTIWVSFDDKKIRKYNIYAEPEKLDGTNWYWQVSNSPDGLYYDGSPLQYCSSGTNRVYRISSTGVETDLGIVSKRLSLDGVATDSLSVDYTTQEYTGYNPTAISTNYLCSSGKINKRYNSSSNLIQTIPTSAPIWTNEQDTPASVVGIVEVGDNTIPGGIAIYLASTDGNIYDVRFVSKESSSVFPVSNLGAMKLEIGGNLSGGYGYMSNSYQVGSDRGISERGQIFFPNWNVWWDWLTGPGIDPERAERWISTGTYRTYSRLTPPTSFIEVSVVSRWSLDKFQSEWDGTTWVNVPGPYPLSPVTHSICSFDESWTWEQKFNNPVLSTGLWTIVDPGTGVSIGRKVTDVTGIIPMATFYYAGIYGDESQTLSIGSVPRPDPIPIGYVTWVSRIYKDITDQWAFLTDDGDLEISDQSTTPSGIWEGIGTGSRISMRLKIGYPSSMDVGETIQFEAHGKEPLAWVTSDENVGKIDSNGLFTAVGNGTCTVTVTDALGNMATSGAIIVQ